MWIAYLAGALVTLAAFLLWVPLDIDLVLDVRGRPRFTAGYSWLFGLVKRRSPPPRVRAPQKGKKRRLPDVGLIFRLARTRGLISVILRLGKSTLTSIRWRDVRADFRVGLGDPADTGMLLAFLGPAAAFLGPAVFDRLRLQPSFDDDVLLEGSSRATARLRPVRLVPPALRFMFSRPAFRAAWRLLASRSRRKRRPGIISRISAWKAAAAPPESLRRSSR